MRRPNEIARGNIAEDVVFAPPAFADLVSFIGLRPPETGGLLLGSRDDYVVTKFVFDDSGSRTRSSYDPDVVVLNKIVKREWLEHGLQLIGWAHSHPRGVERLSGDYGSGKGDIAYLTNIFHAMPKLPKFIVPILFSSDDGPLTVYPYVAYRDAPAEYRMGRLVVATPPSTEAQDMSPQSAEPPRAEEPAPLVTVPPVDTYVPPVNDRGRAGFSAGRLPGELLPTDWRRTKP